MNDNIWRFAWRLLGKLAGGGLLPGFVVALLSVSAAHAVTYANVSVPFSWVDPATHAKVGYNTAPYKFNGGGGCGTNPPTIDDTLSDNIPIGFNFMYSGVVFANVRIMSNGRLQFNNNTTCGYGTPVTQLPYPNAGLNYTMRIYGNDLDPTAKSEVPAYNTTCLNRGTCFVSYATLGAAPYRSFVVTWRNVPEWTSSGSISGNYNLQVILQENGEFIYQYGANTPGPGNATAQVGWQADTLDYSVPSVGYPANNSAVKFYIPQPVAEYRMEQPSWTGAAQEILDTSGNGRHASRIGAPQTTAAGYLCRGAAIPGNSNNGNIDAIDTGIAVPSTLGGAGTISFWYQPANWAGNGNQDAQLLDATTASPDWFFLVKRKIDNSNVRLRFVIRDSTGADRIAETPNLTNSVLSGAGWVHIAVSWNFNNLAAANSDHLRIYVNGVQQTQLVFTTGGTVSGSIGTLYLGDNRSSANGVNSTGNSADGTLDEVRLYNFEGGVALVRRDQNQPATACVTGPNHIRVFLNNNATALTCSPRGVDAVACADAGCVGRFGADVSVTLNPNGTAATIPANGTGTPSVAQVTAGTTGITLGSSNPAAGGAPTFRCYAGTIATPGTEITGACNLAFSDAGFFVSVPDHVSCTTQTLTITAAKTDDVTRKCVPAFDSGVSRDIKLRFAYNNPGNGTIVPTVGSANPPTQALSTGSDLTLAMTFTGGVATTNFRYRDAGRLTVSASYTGSAGTGDAGLSMTTASNPPFVVAPANFAISGIPAAPLTAGQPFNVTATAKSSCGETTANFGQEAPPAATATLTSSNPDPGMGNATAISQTLSGFSSGAASANLTWNEVGTVDIAATTTAYLGSSLNVSGTQAAVGRFKPGYFDTIVTHGCGIFTYAGLNFVGSPAYQLAGQSFTVQVKAKRVGGNSTDGTNTANYAGATWAKAVTLSDANAGTGTLTNGSLANTAFVSGIGSRSDVSYAFGSKLTVPYTLVIRAVDTDGVSSSGHAEGSTPMRSGRLRLSNAFGSEKSDMAMPVQAQYWSGQSWLLNNNDSCTTVPANAFFLVGAPTGVNASAVAIANGVGTLTLSKPSPAATAHVDVSANLGAAGVDQSCLGTHGGTASNRPWLRSQNGNCAATYDRDPSARASFGIYAPETTKTIHVRERF